MSKPIDQGQLKLRLPLLLKAWLQEQAEASCRSMTAEILYRLQKSREQQLAAINTAAPQGGKAGDCVS